MSLTVSSSSLVGNALTIVCTLTGSTLTGEFFVSTGATPSDGLSLIALSGSSGQATIPAASYTLGFTVSNAEDIVKFSSGSSHTLFISADFGTTAVISRTFNLGGGTTPVVIPGLPSAPSFARAYLGLNGGASFNGSIFLEWEDTAKTSNTSFIDASNNIFYTLQYKTLNDISFQDVSLNMVADNDLSANNSTIALIRKPRANLKNLGNSTFTNFTVKTGQFHRNDFSLNDVSFSSLATAFTLFDGCGNFINPSTNIKTNTTDLSLNLFAAKVDSSSVFLPPGTYQVGNSGTDLFGNNPYFGALTGAGRSPYGFRWTIKNPIDGKIYAARQSDFSGADVPPVARNASFSLSKGNYTFTGFPLITFPDNSGNMVVDAENSWPVIVLQDISNNGTTTRGTSNVGYNVSGIDATRNLTTYFKNPKTKALSTILPPGINSNGYYSFFDASINAVDNTRYRVPSAVNDISSAILVKTIGISSAAETFPKPYNMTILGNVNQNAASLNEDISTNSTGDGWLELLPSFTNYFVDISNAIRDNSRNNLKIDISNGRVFPRFDTSANPFQLPLYTSQVNINVTSDFSNNPIHFFDAVWGWNTQGYNMFTYQPGIDVSGLLGTSDFSNTLITAATTGTLTKTIDLSNVLSSAFGSNLSLLTAGTNTEISRNQQAIFNSLKSKVNFGTKDNTVTVPINMFPLNNTLASLVNRPNSSIKTVRLLNSGTAGTTVTNSKISTFSLATLQADQLVVINLDTAGDSITLTGTVSQITITLNTTKATRNAANLANQYTVVGADSINNNGITPDAGSNAVDGSIVLFKGITIVLGTTDVLPGNLVDTAICFHKGTRILTPEGYKKVEDLAAGDFITTTKNIKESIPIRSLIKFISKREDGALYCLPKDSLKKGKPLNDLFMSGDHAFKHNGIWKHMNCASKASSQSKCCTYETDADDIEYYHIVIEDYFAHTIVAEGVEVETCFEDKNDGVIMLWSCDEKCCTPLKCEKSKFVEKKKIEEPKRSIFSMKSLMVNNNNNNTESSSSSSSSSSSFIKLIKGEKKKKSIMTWRYDKLLNRNVPLDCNEINLPN